MPTSALQPTGIILTLCLLAGCAMSGGPKIHASVRGSVQLQEVSDWAFEASHPAVIDQLTMLKIVKGAVSDEPISTQAKMPATGGKPMRIFSDEDAEFLAPLLAQGLSQAKPEQILGFTVSSSAGSGAEPTAGTLYVQGGSIYLTITPSRSRKASGFMPGAAARIEKAQSFAGTAGAMSLIIDYQALAKINTPAGMSIASQHKPMTAPAAPVMPPGKVEAKQEIAAAASPVTAAIAPSAGSPAEMSNDDLLNRKMDELRQARETNRMKETEIAVLKKEIAWMKQELRERNDEIKAMRGNKVSTRPATKKKSAEAYSTR
jgi:hypothetical protein